MDLFDSLSFDAVLDAACEWLCHRRRDYPDHADVWSFRRDWATEKARIKGEVVAGRFRFGLLDRITKADSDVIDLWSARDALVLKALTIVLADVLPVSPRCTYGQGPRWSQGGGAAGAPSSRHQPVCHAHRCEVLLRLHRPFFLHLTHFLSLLQERRQALFGSQHTHQRQRRCAGGRGASPIDFLRRRH